MSNLPQKKEETPIDKLKKLVNSDSVQSQFKNALAEHAPLFVASLIDLFASDTYLQKCAPNLVIMEALKAATLKLPINKNLGFAWVIPRYSNKAKTYLPAFQLGWKGYVQLAQRTAQYRYINCGPVYEGELRKISKLTGEVDVEGDRTSDVIIGYFSFIELLNGFSKASYWPKELMEKHAIRYNPECKKENKLVGVWREHFDERAMATALKHLISKYGIMSVEMCSAFTADQTDERTTDEQFSDELGTNANQGEVIDIDPGTGEVEPSPMDLKAQEISKLLEGAVSIEALNAIKFSPAEVGKANFTNLINLLHVRQSEFKDAAADGPDF